MSSSAIAEWINLHLLYKNKKKRCYELIQWNPVEIRDEGLIMDITYTALALFIAMISITSSTGARSRKHCPTPRLIGVSLGLATSLFTILPSAIASDRPPANTRTETVTETLVIGRSPRHHYVVIIPVAPITQPFTSSAQLKQLQTIRTIAPQAFLSGHALGDYIYVGGFDRYSRAKEEAKRVKPYSGNVRIVYFP
jgi:hypothetical protein